MDLSTFIVAVFCLIDDQLEGSGRLRRRGPAPRLADSEVLTIETVGEFLGLDNDEAIRYFREHYGEWFPALRKVHRHLRQAGGQPLDSQGEHLARPPLSDSSRSRLRALRFHALAGLPVRALTAAGASAARRPSARTRSSSRPSTVSGYTYQSVGRASSSACRWPRPTSTSFPCSPNS